MEKYRLFGDASTGINPFLAFISPTTIGRIMANIVFPFRLLFTLITIVPLLVLMDLLMYVLYILHVRVLGVLLLAPLQRGVLRLLLFFMGHVCVERFTGNTKAVRAIGGGSQHRPPRSLSGGDVVLSTMQSAWDVAVLELTTRQPLFFVAFANMEDDMIQHQKKHDDEDFVRVGDAHLRVFGPSPFQRWRVWRYLLRTGQMDYLNAQQDGWRRALKNTSGDAIVVMEQLQRRAESAGIPVIYFGELTCTNGQGVLQMPSMRCAGRRNTDTSSSSCSSCRLVVASTYYNTPALGSIVSGGALASLRQASALLYGSSNASWSSPFFPTAEVLLSEVEVPLARRAVQKTSSSSSSPTIFILDVPAMDASLRPAMCMANKFGISNPGGGAMRRPVAVGVEEKCGFVKAVLGL